MLLKERYKGILVLKNIKTLFTVHNLQYQGNFPAESIELLDVSKESFGAMEFYGQLSYMKAGLNYADAISTVSVTYSEEIQTSQYGYGLDGVLREKAQILHGIVNGIDFELNNPETDKRIYKGFSAKNPLGKKENKLRLQEELGLPQKADTPIFAMVSRLADQKGFDILACIFESLMTKDVQFVLLGTGEQRYENMFKYFADKYSEKVSATLVFDDVLAQKIYSGADIFLMPSLFEPCGLGQLIALRYGTVPVARKTGGLADTVLHYDTEKKTGNGFLFEDYNGSGFLWGINEALKIYHSRDWDNIIKNAMECDFSWRSSAGKYIELYESLLK